MRKLIIGALFAAASLGVSEALLADNIELWWERRSTTAEEIGDGAPEGAVSYDFFATTDGDILAINFAEINIEGLYQNDLGNNNAPPNPALLPTFPALGADSFITTPGDTSVLGGGFAPLPDGDDTFGDTSSDGPQTAFNFARLTFPRQADWSFSGRFDIASTDDPGTVFSQEFVLVPEPTCLALTGLAMVGAVSLRRRR